MGPPLHVLKLDAIMWSFLYVCIPSYTRPVITRGEILTILTFITTHFKSVKTAVTKQSCVPVCKWHGTAKLKI